MSVTEFLSKNFETWQLWKEKSEVMRLEYKNGELTNSIKVKTEGISARINGVYFFATNKGEEKLKELIKPGKEKRDITLSSAKGEHRIAFDVDLEEIANEIIYFLKDKDVKYQLVVSKKCKDQLILNSNGAEVRQRFTYNAWIVTLVKKSFGRTAEIFVRDCSCLNPVEPDLEKIEEHLEILEKLINAKPIKHQTTNIVLDPEISDLLIHEAYGHALEKDHIDTNTSIFSKQRPFLGKEITIYENPLEASWGYYKFDDEGFPARKKVLVENGVIKGFIEDGKYGSGGWGRMESVYTPPYPRMACTILEPGEYTKDELIEEAKNGYLLCGFAGGEVNPKNGNFMFGSMYAYKIENGELTEICKGVAFEGNILNVGKKVVGRSRDLVESFGMCGKHHFHVPVSSKTPYILLKDIKI